MMRSLRPRRWRRRFLRKARDQFRGADGAVDELEVDIPEGDARHGGELVPCEAVLQDRRLAFGCPGSNPVWPLAHTGLVVPDQTMVRPCLAQFFLVSATASSSNGGWLVRRA